MSKRSKWQPFLVVSSTKSSSSSSSYCCIAIWLHPHSSIVKWESRVDWPWVAMDHESDRHTASNRNNFPFGMPMATGSNLRDCPRVVLHLNQPLRLLYSFIWKRELVSQSGTAVLSERTKPPKRNSPVYIKFEAMHPNKGHTMCSKISAKLLSILCVVFNWSVILWTSKRKVKMECYTCGGLQGWKCQSMQRKLRVWWCYHFKNVSNSQQPSLCKNLQSRFGSLQ